ncbi:MAG: acyltransferase [Bacteroidales bacterium]|nr:acyltransferase [Bacteroidales bacterium]
MKSNFYSVVELLSIGFKSVSSTALISRKASIYGSENIEIGDHVRIDDFCILSGKIRIGNYVHISAYTAIYASFGVEIEDFVTVSGRVSIYSQNDDYSGEFMTNPMVPKQFTNITGGNVKIKKYSIVGAGSIILPSVQIGEGSCVASLSLVKKSLEPWKIYGGIPAIYIKDRKKDITKLAAEFNKNIKDSNL